MKKIFITIIASLGLTTLALAAELNLQSGESAYIRANIETYVTCNGASSGSSCSEKVNSTKLKFEYCSKSSSSDYCFRNVWTKFLSNVPECASLAFEPCMKACTLSSSNDYCFRQCDK